MINIIRGYIFRLYPNKEQKILIEKSFGCSRFIYNYFLNKYTNYINASINIMLEGLKLYMKKDLELQVN